MSELPGKTVLRTVGLTKRFGSVTAVDGLNLEVRAGEVFGFLGPNGSGKSTTVGMILGLIAPSAGRVELFGREVGPNRTAVARRVGAIIETPAFYPFLSGRDNLRALALAAGGVPGRRIDQLLTQMGLTERARSKVKTYSLGMKQRLGIASTLLTDPALVILDEPINGLDPAGQHEIRNAIVHLAAEGRAVLLASHLFHEVEQVCDRVAIIRRGRLVEQGTVQDLVRRGAALEVALAPQDLELGATILRRLEPVERVELAEGRLLVRVPEEAGPLVNRALADQGLYAGAIVPRRTSLEDVFLELTAGSRPGKQGDVPVETNGGERAAPAA
jgi:ABC-2 type transport system ATP-binding protein